MKRSHLFRVILLGFAIALLTGCFDVAQHITRASNGDIVSFVRFTFDKSLFSITEQMGGEPVDYDSMLADADLTEGELLDTLPPGVIATYTPINSAARFGFSTRLAYSARDGAAPFRGPQAVAAGDPSLEAIFFPYLYEGGVAIPFEGIEDADEESEPFLASSLYSISLGKPLMGSVSEVHVAPVGEALGPATEIDVNVEDYEDFFLLEIPLSEFIGAGTRIVFILP